MLRLAHRGDHRRAAENTLAAIVAAVSTPACDGVEFDVRAASDGTAIVLHDETLARVFGGSHRAAERTSADLAAAGVPTLAEILGLLPTRAFLDVDLKEDVVPAVVSLLSAARGDPPANVVVSSLDAGVLGHLAALRPDWPRWLNTFDPSPPAIAQALDLGCRGVSVEWHALDRWALERAFGAGLEVAAWTIRRRTTASRLEREGVAVVEVAGAALDP